MTSPDQATPTPPTARGPLPKLPASPMVLVLRIFGWAFALGALWLGLSPIGGDGCGSVLVHGGENVFIADPEACLVARSAMLPGVVLPALLAVAALLSARVYAVRETQLRILRER